MIWFCVRLFRKKFCQPLHCCFSSCNSQLLQIYYLFIYDSNSLKLIGFPFVLCLLYLLLLLLFAVYCSQFDFVRSVVSRNWDDVNLFKWIKHFCFPPFLLCKCLFCFVFLFLVACCHSSFVYVTLVLHRRKQNSWKETKIQIKFKINQKQSNICFRMNVGGEKRIYGNGVLLMLLNVIE